MRDQVERGWKGVCASRLRSAASADLTAETGLDGGDGATGAAGVAGNEVETVLSLVEFGIGATAGLAGDVFN